MLQQCGQPCSTYGLMIRIELLVFPRAKFTGSIMVETLKPSPTRVVSQTLCIVGRVRNNCLPSQNTDNEINMLEGMSYP